MGIVGMLHLGDALIGTIRAVPMGYGLTPSERLLSGIARFDVYRCERSWEVGRLVLAPAYRAGFDFLRHCMVLSLDHLVRTGRASDLFASCNPVLERLYRRFGFKVLIKDACRDDRQSYAVIHAGVAQVERAAPGSPPMPLMTHAAQVECTP